MFGDGLQYCAIISLPFRRINNGEYIYERIIPQVELLEILRDLPVYSGVGARRDVTGKEEFCPSISGESVELNGFLDLSGICYIVRLELC